MYISFHFCFVFFLSSIFRVFCVLCFFVRVFLSCFISLKVYNLYLNACIMCNCIQYYFLSAPRLNIFARELNGMGYGMVYCSPPTFALLNDCYGLRRLGKRRTLHAPQRTSPHGSMLMTDFFAGATNSDNPGFGLKRLFIISPHILNLFPLPLLPLNEIPSSLQRNPSCPHHHPTYLLSPVRHLASGRGTASSERTSPAPPTSPLGRGSCRREPPRWRRRERGSRPRVGEFGHGQDPAGVFARRERPLPLRTRAGAAGVAIEAVGDNVCHFQVCCYVREARDFFSCPPPPLFFVAQKSFVFLLMARSSFIHTCSRVF